MNIRRKSICHAEKSNLQEPKQEIPQEGGEATQEVKAQDEVKEQEAKAQPGSG